MSFDPYSTQTSSYGIAPDLQFYNGASSSTSGTSMHPSTSSGMAAIQHLGGSGAGPNGGVGDYYGVVGAGSSGPSGSMQSGGVGGQMLPQGGFWSAFTAAPLYEGESPLLEGASPLLPSSLCAIDA